ncbi:fimbrial protein [Klebsiella pneumoniae]|uniref:fimbrial protein n=1 Tax=Klebsiella pneumoniae TaxID=573 RepID=UPI0034CF9150
MGYVKFIEDKYLFLFFIYFMLPSSALYAETISLKDNLIFTGELVKEPCELDINSSEINVEFGTIPDKYLYKYSKTHSQSFTIRLLSCDISISDQVQVMFSGDESNELPGFLKVSSGPASGIAIGLEDENGDAVSINKLTPKAKLGTGTNLLNFRAFVQAEPSAINYRTVRYGDFKAVTTFEIEYP